MMFCLYYISNTEMHEELQLPTPESEFQRSVKKCLINMQTNGSQLLYTTSRHKRLQETI